MIVCGRLMTRGFSEVCDPHFEIGHHRFSYDLTKVRNTPVDAPQEQSLAQVSQGQTVAQTANATKAMMPLGRLVRFSTPPLRSLNFGPQSLQRNRR